MDSWKLKIETAQHIRKRKALVSLMVNGETISEVDESVKKKRKDSESDVERQECGKWKKCGYVFL